MEDLWYNVITKRTRRSFDVHGTLKWGVSILLCFVIAGLWDVVIEQAYRGEQEMYTEFCVHAFNVTETDCDEMYRFILKTATGRVRGGLMANMYGAFLHYCRVAFAYVIFCWFRAGRPSFWNVFVGAHITNDFAKAFERERLARPSHDEEAPKPTTPAPSTGPGLRSGRPATCLDVEAGHVQT